MITASEVHAKIKENIQKVIIGKDEVIDLLIITMFSKGHMLLEDVPGTGKTMLIKALAASVSCDSKRIQFTPDLLPSDITGVNFFNMKSSEFEFVRGPIFTNILLADEINRATPKTQSGLLECMEEYQVSIDGVTYKMDNPFMVVATQNPIENMGVYPLPEAQLDRFLVKSKMNYPDHTECVEILARFDKENPLELLTPVVSKEDIAAACEETQNVFVHKDMMDYISVITEKTRGSNNVILGVSPRGGISLMRVSKGYAAIAGRNYITPDDVKKAAGPTLAHRIMLSGVLKIKKDSAENIVNEIIDSVRVPTEYGINFKG